MASSQLLYSGFIGEATAGFILLALKVMGDCVDPGTWERDLVPRIGFMKRWV
jgi:hypothetical protein